MSFPKSLLRLLPKGSERNKLGILAHSSSCRRSLPETLSRLSNDGVGACVRRCSWLDKGITNSWWQITRVKLKKDGQHGKAWGRLWWKGKLVTDPAKRYDELIHGGLRHTWTFVNTKELEALGQPMAARPKEAAHSTPPPASL